MIVLPTLGNINARVFFYQVMALDFGELALGMKQRNSTQSEVIS